MKLILNIVSLRKSVVLIAFFSFASILYCQEKSEAQHPTNYNYNDSVKIKILNDSVWSLMFNDIQKAIPYAISSLSLSEKLKNPYSLSDTYNTLCVLYYVSSQFDSSIFYGKKSLKIRENLKDEKGLISTYNNLGSNYKELGDYKLEVTYYFKAL